MVQSVRAYPTVMDIPDEVDLAIIVVPKDHVLAAVDDCAAKGVKGVVIISAGFGETGAAGKALQDELARKVRASGMRMVGPNCMGLLNTDPAFSLAATFAPTWPTQGPVAFSSQSGALGLAVLDHARELGMGFSQFVSVGNKADVSGNDLLEYWEADPKTRVILLYLESLGNPQRFMKIARRVGRTKPIIVVKSGRTEAGARAASSHTGSLAGLDVAVDALLGQAGVIRTDTIEELFDTALLLANQPVPMGNRVAVVTNAGGPGIMATDACESHGLSVPPLGATTVDALRLFLPPEASLKNPVDMIASAGPEAYEKSVRLALADPGVDSVMVLFVPPLMTTAPAVAEAIRRGAAGARKPVVTCFMGAHGLPEVLSTLRDDRFPSFAFPEPAAIALSRAVRYGQWLRRAEGSPPVHDEAAARRTQAVLKATRAPEQDADGSRWLDPLEVREVLSAYGIATPRTEVAHTPDEAVAAAKRVGFPVVIKLLSSTITHKSEVGGVRLGVQDADTVREVFVGMKDNMRRLGKLAAMEGVLVQAMVPSGVETFVGATRSPSYGPLVAFGLGGVNVELWKDVVFRVNPITDVDAHEMLNQVRAVKLLDGFRGAPPADRKALVDALLRVSAMMADHAEFQELDINPLIAHAPGHGAVAADARIRVRLKS
jgi:acetyl coenzyme A synthetase (ADP forming)-like protein